MTKQPENERERLEELLSYEILDTPNEPAFDDIAALAAQRCDAPMAFVTLVDREREWFKATFGVGADFREVPRDGGFCATAILRPHETLTVRDATADSRFAENPAVTGPFGLRFYCGVPIISRAGFALGTLSVVDTKVRDLDEEQLHTLRTLTCVVADQLELRRVSLDIELAGEEQERLRTALNRSPVLSGTSLEATISNASQVADRLGVALRASTTAAEAGDINALVSYAAQVTRAMQDLLLSLSHADAQHNRAEAAAKTLAILAEPPLPN